jgi:hypothetical protein
MSDMDIVDRLMAATQEVDAIHGGYDEDMREAATLIENLRTTVDEDLKYIGHLEAQVARLKRDRYAS